MQYVVKGVFAADNRTVFVLNDGILSQMEQFDIADSQAVCTQIVAAAAEFIMNDIAVVENEIAFLCRIVFLIDDINTCAFIDQQNLQVKTSKSYRSGPV